MGLDQYATVILAAPENEPAKVPAKLVAKINQAIYNLKIYNSTYGPDRLEIADYPDYFEAEKPCFIIYNFNDTDYKYPIFKLNYQHDDYLARKNHELLDYLFNTLKPKLKPTDLVKIKDSDIYDNIEDYTIDDYFDITDYIAQINQEIAKRNIPYNLEIDLMGLLSYQKTCQAVLDKLDTNLTAHVCYQQDF